MKKYLTKKNLCSGCHYCLIPSFLIIFLMIPVYSSASSSWADNLNSSENKKLSAQYTITAEELDGMIYAYADSYMTQIVSATREISRQAESSQQRSDAMLLRVGSVNSIYDIASSSEPFTKLLDMLLVVTLQSYVWIDEDRAEKIFGHSAKILIDAMHQNRKEIWKLAAKAMKPEQLYILDWLILDWRRQNPDINFVIFTRFSDVSASRVKSIVSDVKIGSGFLAPVDEAKKAINETRLLAERSFFYAKRAPLIYTWQAENLTTNILAKPEIAQLLEGIKRSTLAIERVSEVMKNLPGLIREERVFISSELDKRETSISKVLAEVRQTINETEHLVVTVDKLSDSGNNILHELRVTSESLNTTLITFDSMMSHHFPALSKEEKARDKSKPFNINEYTEALAKVDSAAEELTGLMGASGNMINSDKLTYRIEQLNSAARDRVEHATEQSKKMIQTLFLYVALTLVLAFSLMVFYRKLFARNRGEV